MHLKENIPLNECKKTIIQIQEHHPTFFFLVSTEAIVENTLPTLVVAIGKSHTNLRSM